jgi:hypothetical protein
MREVRHLAGPSSRGATHMSLRNTDMVRLAGAFKGPKHLKNNDF